MDTQRFPFGRSQLATFLFLAVIAVAGIVGGVVAGDVIVLVFGVVFAGIAALLARPALGPAAAYELRAEGLAHVRGDETLLLVPYDEITDARIIPATRVSPPQLAVSVKDRDAILGGHDHRNTKAVTGWDIVLNLGPVKGDPAAVEQALLDRLPTSPGGRR